MRSLRPAFAPIPEDFEDKTSELLGRDLMADRISDLFSESDRLFATAEREGWDSLSEKEADFLSIWLLEADVNNGGFHQYYSNSWSARALRAAEALRRIGAGRAAAIVEEANRLFGDEGPPEDRFVRQQRLDEICGANEEFFDPLDQRFVAYPDPIEQLLLDYLGIAPR